MSIVRALPNHRSHETGPNITIELNFWHAKTLMDFLQQFELAAGSIGLRKSGSIGPLIEGHFWDNETATKEERALAELFLNLKYVIDHNT